MGFGDIKRVALSCATSSAIIFHRMLEILACGFFAASMISDYTQSLLTT